MHVLLCLVVSNIKSRRVNESLDTEQMFVKSYLESLRRRVAYEWSD